MILGNLCDIVRGSSPRPQGDARYFGGNIPRLMIADVTRDGMYVTPKIDSLTEEGALKSRSMKKGDVIIAVSGDPGRACILEVDACIHDGFVGLRNLDENQIYKPYLLSYLAYFKNVTKKGAVGAIFQNLTTNQIKKIEIPYISLPAQIHIANLLSKAEDLINQRKESIRLLDEFLKSTFLEMFGDPVRNDKKWGKRTLKEIALRFSDGPFGSNLKIEHYSEDGIQVIRLQNIGINQFKEEDITFVKENHYENVLRKYTCFPGDIVIATMGSPNVRACIVPKHIRISINKADCVLCRVNEKYANSYYISHLLNQDGFLQLAGSYIHGQTRSRIASGQLAQIAIPIPPLPLQTQFAQIVEKTEALKAQYKSSLQELENLYGSLSQRAFKGELTLEKEESMMMAAEPLAEYNATIS